MLGLKKKTPKPHKEDLAVLDASVDKLSEQTSELLKDFGASKKESKEHTKPHSTELKAEAPTKVRSVGHSFDIIQNPRQKSNLKPSPKSRPNTSDEETLLPEHAGKSFNELTEVKPEPKVESVKTVDDVVASTDVNTAIIKSHSAGALNLIKPTEAEKVPVKEEQEPEPNEQAEKADKNELPEEPKKAEIVEEVSNDPLKESSMQASDQGIQFEEAEKVAADEKKADDVKLEPTHEKVIAPSKELVDSEHEEKAEAEKAADETKESDRKEELSASGSGELYANNLVAEVDPKGYEPVEGQQKPTVFDTKEYHLELHDWSKLEKSGGSLGYVLALLVVIAAALAYFIISGVGIPFIS